MLKIYAKPGVAVSLGFQGERDYAYIGRWQVINNRYQTLAGGVPFIGDTSGGDSRATFREGIHTYQSEGFHMQDFAAFWTIRMLYLVEFANWNCQETIGIGVPDSLYPRQTGLTASMSYHTGTISYGCVSYRYIENLWTNAEEFVDGIRRERGGRTVYVNNNPEYGRAYPDDPGTVELGFQSVNMGYTTGFYVPTEAGVEYAVHPDAVISSAYGALDEYISDLYTYGASGIGGEYMVGGTAQHETHGMFFMSNAMSETADLGTVNDGFTSTRVQYLP